MGDVYAGQLEIELLDDVKALLDWWRMQYAGDPDGERQQLWLFALEREQIVAVAYREGAVGERLELLPVAADIRALVRQTLVWIWKDEELHAEYLRGLLLARRGLMASLVVYGRQLQGALSGWVSATEHHVRAEEGRLRIGAAGLLVAAAGALGRIPPVLQRELHYQTFRRYCVLNVALEATAELGVLPTAGPGHDRRGARTRSAVSALTRHVTRRRSASSPVRSPTMIISPQARRKLRCSKACRRSAPGSCRLRCVELILKQSDRGASAPVCRWRSGQATAMLTSGLCSSRC